MRGNHIRQRAVNTQNGKRFFVDGEIGPRGHVPQERHGHAGRGVVGRRSARAAAERDGIGVQAGPFEEIVLEAQPVIQLAFAVTDGDQERQSAGMQIVAHFEDQARVLRKRSRRENGDTREFVNFTLIGQQSFRIRFVQRCRDGDARTSKCFDQEGSGPARGIGQFLHDNKLRAIGGDVSPQHEAIVAGGPALDLALATRSNRLNLSINL